MKMKEFVAYGLLGSLSLTLIIAILEPLNEDNWYSLVGVCFFIFGIWGGVLLLKK